MPTARGLRLRRSFRDLEKEHFQARKDGHTEPTELETLILAFKGIFELPPTDQNSFFIIAGYHGEPFRGAGWSNSMWWGGYCYHGQILFPTWHRAYANRLEHALRSIPGCEYVALPFLDWCDEETRASGLPGTFGLKEFTLADGTNIKNPLYSYTFQSGVFDNLAAIPDTDYTKPAGYETVRYPLSGLVGTSPDQVEKTKEYNAQYEYPKNIEPLNENIKGWLYHDVIYKNKTIHPGTYEKFRKCLEAPNYTLFSNTSSAQQHNQEYLDRKNASFSDKDINVVPLESPHNDMHLATGGFSVPIPNPDPGQTIIGPNGDMGENDTASFDPIFFFHHCFVDRMFWLWQLKHNQTTELVIEQKYKHFPGANNFDSQGPTPGRAAGDWLTLSTPLDPFAKSDGTLYTSLDVIDIEMQLGYTYGPGSFTDEKANPQRGFLGVHGQPLLEPAKATLAISGLNRGAISGSFVISTWGTIEGKRQLLGTEAVLSRLHTQGCANCQTHLNVKSFVPLYGLPDEESVENADLDVRVHTHDDPSGLKHKRGKKAKKVPVFHG